METDLAVMLSDNPVDGVQPQPGAFALRLGGEERLEDASLNIGRNAGAVVVDFDQNVIRLDRRANPQVALAVHRVNRVEDQVGPYFIDRAAVSGNARQVGGVFAGHRYAALQLMAEDDERVLQPLMHVHLLQVGAIHVRILLIARTRSEMRAMLCSISLTNSCEDHEASSHCNASLSAWPFKHPANASNSSRCSPARTKVGASFQPSAI